MIYKYTLKETIKKIKIIIDLRFLNNVIKLDTYLLFL